MIKMIFFNFLIGLIYLVLLIDQPINCDTPFHDLTNIPINDDHEVKNNTNLDKNIINNQTISQFDLTGHSINDNVSTTINHTQATVHSETTNHQSKCELITLPMCKNIGYNHTKMPNQLNHETQDEAGLEVHQFYPLVEINCSDDLQLFLCLIYAPVCMEDFNG